LISIKFFLQFFFLLKTILSCTCFEHVNATRGEIVRGYYDLIVTWWKFWRCTRYRCRHRAEPKFCVYYPYLATGGLAQGGGSRFNPSSCRTGDFNLCN